MNEIQLSTGCARNVHGVWSLWKLDGFPEERYGEVEKRGAANVIRRV